MALYAHQATFQTSRAVFRCTLNSNSKSDTVITRLSDRRTALGYLFVSFRNLHRAKPPRYREILPSVKSWSVWQILNQLRWVFNEKLTVLSVLFARQFHAIAAQRIRRAAQIVNLYNNIGYDRKMIEKMVEKFSFTKRLGSRPFGLLLGAAFFVWDKERITEDEMTKVAEEISQIHRTTDTEHLNTWEKVIDKGFLTVCRKPVPNSYLYEYKVYGSYHDLPARAFFSVQVDLEFRKQWDKLVISLDVIDKEDDSGSEVVQWITHYPYPMYSREYVYIRKFKVDHEKMLMVIINRSTDHPACPVNNNKYVRVDTYMSKMVIRPHTSFDENGFDYVLTYYDDPKAAFPSVAYNWMANTGVPDFVEKLYTAAKLLQDHKKALHTQEPHADPEKETIAM